MAEFDFYGSQDDWWLYLGAIVHMRQYSFVVDKWYKEHKPFEFEDLTLEFKSLLQKRRRVYLWSNQYSRFRPDFGDHNELMMIDPVSSGPALDLTLPACYEHNGVWRLNHGSLFYQPVYRNPDTQELYKPPEALKKAYKAVQLALKKTMQRRFIHMEILNTKGVVKMESIPIWIGPNAIKLLEANKAQIRIYGEWKTGSDLKLT